MKISNKYTITIIVLGLFILFAMIIVGVGRVRLNSGNASVMHTLEDSIMIEGRHMGWVNVKKFVALAQKLPPRGTIFTSSDYTIDNDSISITVRNKRLFYGTDDGGYWIDAYKNMPIRFTEDGFIAPITEIDSVIYMYIPYQILSSVAGHVDSISPIRKEERIDNTPNEITIRDKNVLPAEDSSLGKKIQTEGYVLKNVTDILSTKPGLSQYQQMEYMWRYVKDNWNYVNDPAISIDTWRSASETIENYYFVNGKCYTGDCDDFAILMASFARQIGYKSRVVAAFNNKGGHAYAEFYAKGKWIPLDWFSKEFGGKPFEGKRYRVYEDL